MKKLLSLLVLLCMEKALHAQYIYTIKADSVKITNSCDTAELIIENHTQNVCGFLFNKGRGRTEFRRGMMKINDSIYAIGCDTLRLSVAWLQGGNTFGTTGYFGTRDNNHIDYYTNGIKRGRWTNTGNFLVGGDTDYGYKMAVDGPIYGQYFTNSTTLLDAGDGALRLRWGGPGGSYIDFYNHGNKDRRGFISSGADGRPLILYDQVGLSLSTTPFLSVGTEWPTAQNTKFSLTTAFNSTQDPMRVANLISADGLSSISYLRVKASGNTILGEGEDYGYKLAVNGTTYSRFFTNSTTPLGAGGSGALRLRWGGGEGTYVDFYNQGNTNRRGYIGTASDSRPLVITDSIGFSFGYTPYVTFGLENGAALSSRFTIASDRSSGWDAFTILGTSGVYNRDVVVKANGNVVLAGDNGADNGYKLQVNGNGWVRDFFDVGTDSYQIKLKPAYGNGYDNGVDASMISFGNIYGSIGVNKQNYGVIPANSLILGHVSPGSVIAMADYYGNPTIVSGADGRVTINGGYTGIRKGDEGFNANANAFSFAITGVRGTGTGVAGDICFYTGNSQASGTAVHSMTNRWTIKGGTGYLSNSPNPTSMIDVTGATGYSQFRLRNSYTPSSTSDTNGNVGDVSWDDDFFYIKTSEGWKRSALSTF